jgi:SAM-dependent methyltransferase
MTKSLVDICNTVIDYYHTHADKYFDRYEEQRAGDHCHYCLKHIAPPPSRILDIGSGSGRDAAFFSAKGYQVTAVEPAREFRERAAKKHATHPIQWIDDRLPELETFSASDDFDHIHLSAVLFHLPREQTRPVLKRLHNLLKKSGTLFVGLRVGPDDLNRPMFDVNKDWVIQQSESLFTVVHTEESQDDFNRSDVTWQRVMLKK